MSRSTGFIASLKRELQRMRSRGIYIFGILVPLLMAIFFVSLMKDGLPLHVPTAVVDYDHSTMSRSVIRNLGAGELVDITQDLESYDDALEGIRNGSIFGFFVIPENFEKDALGGSETTIEYFTNLTYYIPGSLAFKGFKTVSVTTAGSVVRTKLASMGISSNGISGVLQPVNIQQHLLGNPWMNYSYYLSPSFTACILALMVVLLTIYTITEEIKRGTSVEWLATAKGRMSIALAGKLLPYTVGFFAVTVLILWLMFGYCHFPLNGSVWWIMLAALLLIMASQAFAVIICSIVPNPRLAFSVGGLISILAFSIAGISFPVEGMYGAIGIFNYILPVRHFFHIYINQALNGYDIYYVRYHFMVLLVFPLLAALGLRRLRKACLNPVYVG